MAFRRCNKSIDRDEMLRNITGYDILGRYFGLTSLPVLINSPLRNDRNASMSIYSTDDGHILFKDFGTNERGDIYTLLERMYNMSYVEVLDMIASDIGKGGVSTARRHKRHFTKARTDIQVRTRQWLDYDLEFWGSFGITKEWLEFGDVHPVSHIIITKGSDTNVIVADRLAYAYVERKDGKVSLKIYQPMSKRLKWLSKSDHTVWDLWTRLPRNGDIVFVTSSRKDALCLWANTGIPATSMQGEGYMPKRSVIDELKGRFGRVIVFFDNDFSSDENHGHQYALNLCREFGLEMVEIPSEYKSKDPSDLFKNVGSAEFRRVIRELVFNSKQH